MLVAGCTTSRSIPTVGTERGACYANGTCNAGLTCLSDVCVRLTQPDGGVTDKGVPDKGVPDKGVPDKRVPGADVRKLPDAGEDSQPGVDGSADGATDIGSDGPRITEKIYPQTLEKEVDILFVIDDSGSMEQEQATLIANFPRLIESLRSPKLGPDGSGKPCSDTNTSGCLIPNLHIGVVSSDLGAGNYGLPSCEQPGGLGGKLQNKARKAGCAAPSQAYISYVDGKTNIVGCSGDAIECVKQSFSCIAELGIQGCGFESQLEAARKALSPGVNPNFLRPDALLAVVFITDEDDCSAKNATLFDPSQQGLSDPLGPLTSFRCFEFGISCDINDRNRFGARQNCVPNAKSPYLFDVGDYIRFFRGLKSTPDRVIMAAIAGPTAPVIVGKDGQNPALQPSCQTAHSGVAVPAIRIKTVVDAFSGQATTVCTNDFSPAFSALGKRIVARLGGLCIDSPLILSSGGVACSKGVDVCKMPSCDIGESCNTSLGLCVKSGQPTTNPCGDSCLDKVDCMVSERLGQTGPEVVIKQCPRALFVDTSLPQDACGPSCPCWRIVPRPVDCKPTTVGTTPFGLQIMRVGTPAKGTVAIARCRTASFPWFDWNSTTPVQSAAFHCR
jgi:hypothetical protein